jgi:hypothetical protein
MCATGFGALANTEAFQQSRRERKKIEMRFAHTKRILRLDRLRLRGLSGARDEVLLTATAQNPEAARQVHLPSPAIGAGGLSGAAASGVGAVASLPQLPHRQRGTKEPVKDLRTSPIQVLQHKQCNSRFEMRFRPYSALVPITAFIGLTVTSAKTSPISMIVSIGGEMLCAETRLRQALYAEFINGE